jgi:outer membrane receptor protein involved in Fe transport
MRVFKAMRAVPAALAGFLTVSPAVSADDAAPIPPHDAAAPRSDDTAGAVVRVRETVVIVAAPLEPSLDRRDGAFFRQTLFSRDDQLLHAAGAGLAVGQHEGGGKSVEVRRFGFNLDHGGLSGGLQVRVDGVPQNQPSHGHGQGYLGALKNLTPELVEDVDLVGGPFRVEYGDFSGLGVVDVRLKESLPELLALRLQAGSFGARRLFAAVSPRETGARSFVAYEASHVDGPFLDPLRYRRDNLTASRTADLGEGEALGFRLHLGRNRFDSSGQLPLDEIEGGRLHRFGRLDADSGGRTYAGTFAAHYRRPAGTAGIVKVEGFVARSLFDLYSNFTFFLNDRQRGDEIQQHDSRLREGVAGQYLRSHTLFGRSALFSTGASVTADQIGLALFPTVSRQPLGVSTRAGVHLLNPAAYVQESVERGRLRVETGLRIDAFRFAVDDHVEPARSGDRSATSLQPKLALSFRPSATGALRLHLDYGRGVASQDARGVVQRPEGPAVSATDMVKAGLSRNAQRLSASAAAFVIARDHEQVYVPDDGSIELSGPSRSWGYEARAGARLSPHLTLAGGLTHVIDTRYRDVSRTPVVGAPRLVADAAVLLESFHGVSGSLRYRHVGRYLLDAAVAEARATGHDVLDLGLRVRLSRALTLDLALDNLTDARYWETQNFFESRIRPDESPRARRHGTPGFPRALAVGLTLAAGR